MFDDKGADVSRPPDEELRVSETMITERDSESAPPNSIVGEHIKITLVRVKELHGFR